MCEALRELMKEEIEEELKKNHEQGIEQGRINQLIDLVMQKSSAYRNCRSVCKYDA